MNEPTKEQIQWLWEKYGLKIIFVKESYALKEHWEFWQDGELVWNGTNLGDSIDLNNLFKYAVPKLRKQMTENEVLSLLQDWVEEITIYDDNPDPALALFWAIYKALGGK